MTRNGRPARSACPSVPIPPEQTIAAARYFSANKAQLEKARNDFARHPRQPVGLRPALSPELQADAIAAMPPVKVSRRVRPPETKTVPAAGV